MGMYVSLVMVHTYTCTYTQKCALMCTYPYPYKHEHKQTFTCIYVHIKSTNACTHMYRHVDVYVMTHINGNKIWRL